MRSTPSNVRPTWLPLLLGLAMTGACAEELAADPSAEAGPSSEEEGAVDGGPHADARSPFEAGATGMGGGVDAQASACPAGPQSPLDKACQRAGLTCRYGYEPPECGGRTVICQRGVWRELEHTDPQPACFDRDAGKVTSQLPDASDELCVPYSPTGEGCAYVRTPGVATVTALEMATKDGYSCMNDPRVVRFTFVPDDPRRARCLKEQPASYDTFTVGGGANPPRSCLDAAGISVGTALRVTRQDIALGSCTPVVYDFERALQDACLSACRL